MFTSPDCAVSAGAFFAVVPGIASETEGCAFCRTCQVAIAAIEPEPTTATAATTAMPRSTKPNGLRRGSLPCRVGGAGVVDCSACARPSSDMHLPGSTERGPGLVIMPDGEALDRQDT